MATIKTASNARWADADRTAIDLDVVFAEFPGTHPFTAHPEDIEQHGVELYGRARDGEFGQIADHVMPPPPPDIVARSSKPSMDELYEVISRLQERLAKLEGIG